MADCPSENVLVEFAEGRLRATARERVHLHIDTCADCRALISDLACMDAAPEKPPGSEVLGTAGAPTSRRFRIIRKLGQGGMGVVYEALDRQHNRSVALKTLRSLDPDALLRFKNEFRALQDLQHPNLVRLGDLVEEDGQWWLSMELVAGVDFLTHTRDEGKLRAALAQLVAGLTALHGAGKVHRDIKPHNVMVTATGRVVILDFGLVGERAQLDSAVVGTIAYMAPEQAAGEPTGPAADWYSVGVMLYEALTGSLPTQGSAREVLAGKLQRVVPAHVGNAAVPPDLDALCSELLEPQPERRPLGDEILARLRGAPASQETEPSAVSMSPPFVGRQAELRVLHAAFAKSRAGQSTLLLIEGESGVGKSALVRQFVAGLQLEAPDAVVLTGRCYEREVVPYKAFDGIVDALSRYMKRLSKDRAAALLPRRASTLLQAFPVLGRVQGMAEAPAATETLDPKEQRSRVFAALRELFARLCERQPLLLWIDDLQWTDADSLSLLHHLMSPPDAPPLLLLCTLRPLDALQPVELREESLRRSVERLKLGPLPVEDACDLAERLARQGSAPRTLDLKAIAQEAGGHPLFLDELVRRAQEAPAATAPLRLDDAIWHRVAALPAGAQRLLQLSALAGRPLRTEAAVAASSLSSGDVADWVAQLLSAHLLRTTPLRDSNPRLSGSARAAFEPYHDRVRETITERLDEAQRRELHRALATAFEGETDREPELLALHYRAAGEIVRAGKYAAQAAAQAAQQLAFERAATLYRSALESGAFSDDEQGELSAALGEALANAGRPVDAGEAYLRSGERAAPDRALVLRQHAANQLLRAGQVTQGIEILNGILRPFGLHIGASFFLALCKSIWLGIKLRLRGTRFQVRDEQTLPPRELLRHDLCWMVNLALTSGGLNMRGADFTPRFVLLALQLGEPRRVARALSFLAYGQIVTKGGWSGTSSAELFSRARALLTEQHIDDPYTHAFIDQFESWSLSEQGHFRRARTIAEHAEQTFLQHCPGTTWEVANTRFARLLLAAEMGEFSLLTVEMPRLLRESRERKDRTALNIVGCVHAQPYFLAWDDREEAEHTLALWGIAKDAAPNLQASNYFLLTHVRMALYFDGGIVAYRRYQELTKQLPWVVRHMSIGYQWAQRILLGVTCRLAAIVDGAPHPERLFERNEKALRQAHHIGLGWVDAWALELRAATAVLHGQKAEAIALLRQAISCLETAELHLHVAISRRALGTLLPDEEGAALIERADSWMRDQTIKNPARLARALLPGFDKN